MGAIWTPLFDPSLVEKGRPAYMTKERLAWTLETFNLLKAECAQQRRHAGWVTPGGPEPRTTLVLIRNPETMTQPVHAKAEACLIPSAGEKEPLPDMSRGSNQRRRPSYRA